MTVEIDSTRLRDALSRLAKQVDDPSKALDAAGQRFAELIRENLGRGVQYDGAPMVPLKSRDGVPLNDTRQHIYNRITSQLQGKDSVIVGMLDGPEHIGAVHQFGATIRPKNGEYLKWKDKAGKFHQAKQVTIPARPFFPISPDGQADIPQGWNDETLETLAESLRAVLG